MYTNDVVSSRYASVFKNKEGKILSDEEVLRILNKHVENAVLDESQTEIPYSSLSPALLIKPDDSVDLIVKKLTHGLEFAEEIEHYNDIRQRIRDFIVADRSRRNK